MILVVFLFLTVAAPRAHAAGPDFDRGGYDIRAGLSGIAVPVPDIPADSGRNSREAAAAPYAEWTIMVFMNGKNDLARYALKDINEMEIVGSGNGLNIVAEVGRAADQDDSDGDWTGVRRYLVRKDADFNTVSSPVAEDLGAADMGDYRNLAGFGKWAKKNYPAKKYMLIVWNHGSGWLKSSGTGTNKGISYDAETGNHITTPQLGLALSEMGGVDVYASDACLMQMAEVAYELKDSAAYIAGSAETEPGDGYTYNAFLSAVSASPSMGPRELTKALADSYIARYSWQKGAVFSVLRTSALDGLRARLDAFTAALIKAGRKKPAEKARAGALQYEEAENRDLYDFVRLATEGSGNAHVRAKGRELLDWMSGELVVHNRTANAPSYSSGSGKDYSRSGGLAAYFPAAGLGDGYRELQWAGASQWDEFLLWLSRP